MVGEPENDPDHDRDWDDEWNAWKDLLHAAQDNSNPLPQPPEPAKPGESHDGLGEWDAFLEQALAPPPKAFEHQNIEGQHGHEDRSGRVLSEVEVEPSATMYGPLDHLQCLGGPIQRGLFQEFSTLALAATKRCGGGIRAILEKETLEDTLAQEFVHNSGYKSARCEAESTQRATTSLARNLLQYACALLFGATFLIGAFLQSWSALFRRRKYKPTACITKYDETPLKMRVQEANKFFQTSWSTGAQSRNVRQKAVKAGQLTTGEEVYVHAKIMRVECSLSN